MKNTKSHTKYYLIGLALLCVTGAMVAMFLLQHNSHIYTRSCTYASPSSKLTLTIAVLQSGTIQYKVSDITEGALINEKIGNDAMRWAFEWDANDDLWIYCEEGCFIVHRDGKRSMTRTHLDLHDPETIKKMPAEYRVILPQSLKKLYGL